MKNTDAQSGNPSAAIGPASSGRGFNDDVESLARFSRGGRGAIATSVIPEERASVDDLVDNLVDDLPADPGADDVQTHMSVFTFLKIVSNVVGGDVDKPEVQPRNVYFV